MKNASLLLLLFLASVLISCEKGSELLYDTSEESKKSIQSRATSTTDSVCLFSNTEEFEKPETLSYNLEEDEFYSSNMHAIRELPFSLKARGGGSSGKLYLATQGKRKELISSSDNNSKFYLKILPASSGIPYLIYSVSENMPLVCGQYTNNPDNKLVFVWDSEDLSSGSWNLIPSLYKGYFNIENQTYLGQTDPDNPWSVFNYSIELKKDGKVGYAQYQKQAQQEFLLEFEHGFKVKDISFDSKSAIVKELEPIKVESNGKTADVAGPSNITIFAKEEVNDTSCYTEKGALKIPQDNPHREFLRPTVIAGRFVPPGNFSTGEAADSTLFMPKVSYSSTTSNITKTLSITIPIEVPEPSFVSVTSYLKKYSVQANYTITMTYHNGNEEQEREVKFKGIWSGIVHTTVKAKPDDIEIIPLEEYKKRNR